MLVLILRVLQERCQLHFYSLQKLKYSQRNRKHKRMKMLETVKIGSEYVYNLPYFSWQILDFLLIYRFFFLTGCSKLFNAPLCFKDCYQGFNLIYLLTTDKVLPYSRSFLLRFPWVWCSLFYLLLQFPSYY